MGVGCQEVMQVESSEVGDVILGYWSEDRVGIFRGIRKGKGGFGGIAFLEDDIVDLGGFEGYEPLVDEIIKFYRNGVAPVAVDETLEIYVFMTAAYRSKVNGGIKIKLSDIYDEFGIY